MNKDQEIAIALEQTERLLKIVDAKDAKIVELKANSERLREALEESNALNINWSSDAEANTLEYFSEYRAVIKMGMDALASTPKQSLQAHDDEVIERCAKVCELVNERHNDQYIDAALRDCSTEICSLKGQV